MGLAHDDRRLPPACRRVRGQRGAVLVEFALAGTLFLTLTYGSISYGVVFWVKHTLTSAASEGARAAVSAPTGDEVTTARTAAEGVLDNSLGDRAAHAPPITPTVAACPNSTGNCITVTVSYPYSAHPILPAMPPILSYLPTTLSSTSVIELSS
jgi:Flp pilus assembly protein TadG